jgi:hypothetical protein
MPRYGHDIEFGYFLVPDVGDPEAVLETAVLADQLGYDLLGVQDHPYQPRQGEFGVELLTHLALDLGFGSLRTFIEDVAPEVRERVAAARAGRPAVAQGRPA